MNPIVSATPRASRPDALALLSYTTADRAPIYRAVVDVFAERAETYNGQLRTEELLSALAATHADRDVHPAVAELVGERDLVLLESCLDQLVEWGNLSRARDELQSRSLRSYEARSWVYDLTQAGEAAVRALRMLEEDLERSGGLQSAMLNNIVSLLEELSAGPREQLAPERVFTCLEDLHNNWRAMTSASQVFMQKVGQVLADPQVDPATFGLFKADTIAYLRDFVDHLEGSTTQIRQHLARLWDEDAEALVAYASTANGEFAFEGDSRWSVLAFSRLSSLRDWFCGTATEGPRVDLLHQRATAAVLGIVSVVERLSDSRSRPTSRIDDMLSLASMFQECTDDRAHDLYRAAFGLSSSRHFALAENDPDDVSPSTSWWDAPPVQVPAKLRSSGKSEYIRRASRVPDYAKSKKAAAAKAREEQSRIDAAAATLIGVGRTPLSQLPPLDGATLDVLVSLIDLAMLTTPDAQGKRSAISLDGRLAVFLAPPAQPAAACIESERGTLITLDYALEVTAAPVGVMTSRAEVKRPTSERGEDPAAPAAAAPAPRTTATGS